MSGRAEADQARAAAQEESEDESEVLEESPCGRWQKRKEQVVAGWGAAEERGCRQPSARAAPCRPTRSRRRVFLRGRAARLDDLLLRLTRRNAARQDNFTCLFTYNLVELHSSVLRSSYRARGFPFQPLPTTLTPRGRLAETAQLSSRPSPPPRRPPPPPPHPHPAAVLSARGAAWREIVGRGAQLYPGSSRLSVVGSGLHPGTRRASLLTAGSCHQAPPIFDCLPADLLPLARQRREQWRPFRLPLPCLREQGKRQLISWGKVLFPTAGQILLSTSLPPPRRASQASIWDTHFPAGGGAQL